MFPGHEMFHIHSEEDFVGSTETTFNCSAHVTHPLESRLRTSEVNSDIHELGQRRRKDSRVMWLADSRPGIHVSWSHSDRRTSSIEWLMDPELLDVIDDLRSSLLSEEPLEIGDNRLFSFFFGNIREFLSNEPNQSRNSLRITCVIHFQERQDLNSSHDENLLNSSLLPDSQSFPYWWSLQKSRPFARTVSHRWWWIWWSFRLGKPQRDGPWWGESQEWMRCYCRGSEESRESPSYRWNNRTKEHGFLARSSSTTSSFSPGRVL